MIHDRDLEGLLDSWLADGPLVVADRVIDDVAARIARQPQRPAWRLRPWRFPTMSTSFRIALIGAALVAALGAGALFFAGAGGPSTRVPSPTSAATPSPKPSDATPTASPVAAFPSWFPPQAEGAGILSEGSHGTRQFLPDSTFTVPAGWVNDGDSAAVYTLFPDTRANATEYGRSKQTGQNILITNRVANNMFAICDATGLFEGSTASDVVRRVTMNPAFRFWSSSPTDVTIGGLSGRQVDLRISLEWKGSCALNPNDPPTRDYTDARMRLIVLDTPRGGTIGIAVSSLSSAEFDAFLGEAMPIVQSFRFQVGPSTSRSPSPKP